MRVVLLVCFMAFVSHSFSQTKRALVIAIGKYANSDEQGWKTISSVNDTSFILPAIRKQGFHSSNTQTLIDDMATIQGIRRALNELIDTSEKGDIVLIHVSSHGAQVEDDNNDELDGLDESIVTYNAVSPKFSTDFDKDQLEYLRDDEFGDFVNRLRRKLGEKGDVVVILDNCHSGSGTRNIGDVVRGGETPLVSKNAKLVSGQKDASVFKEKIELEGAATYILISAARAEEQNTELYINDEGVGSLTYAVSKAFEIFNSQLTYRGFFSHIQSTMNEFVPRQHPVLEGDGIDRVLFGGDFKVQDDFVPIQTIEDSSYIVIKAGIIAGLSKGSKVAVYPAGTIDTTMAMLSAFGTVQWSDNYKAGVLLTSPLQKTQGADYWVFIKSTHFPMRPIVLAFNSYQDSTIAKHKTKEIKLALEESELVKFEGKADLMYYFGELEDSIVDCLSGYKWEVIPKESPASILNAAIKRYIQYQFIKSYEIHNKKYPVTIELIPIVEGKADTSHIQSKLNNGTFEFNKGDKFVVMLTNKSPKKIYFNIIDLQPNGIINAIMPNRYEKIKSEELFIETNSSKRFDSYPVTLNPPYGDEVFKLFLSNSKLDLEYITMTKAQGTKSFLTDLESVFKSSYTPSTRGEFGTKEGAVLNVNFRIVEN